MKPIDLPIFNLRRYFLSRRVALYPPLLAIAHGQTIFYIVCRYCMVAATLKKDKPRWPPKYYRGLSAKNVTRRRKEIQKFGKMDWKNPHAYVGFKTDIGRKTRASSYTASWKRLFPDATSLKAKSEATGVPLRFITESYNRGMAAWRTGHRPGATEQQWGYARVHSFLLGGKTHYSTDADLVRKAKISSNSARKWWKSIIV